MCHEEALKGFWKRQIRVLRRSPPWYSRVCRENKHLRSSAGHLAEEAGALRLRRSLLVLLRRRGHGAAGTGLLGRVRRGGGGRASRGARWGTSGRTLTRHGEWVCCEWLMREKDEGIRGLEML